MAKPLCPFCGKPVGKGGLQFVLRPELHRCPRSTELLLRFLDRSLFHGGCLQEFSHEVGHDMLEHVHPDQEAEPSEIQELGGR